LMRLELISLFLLIVSNKKNPRTIMQ
jgi:hypothetical protein